MTDRIEITPYCKKCGATVPVPKGKPDDATLECAACGERFGTIGDVKAKATEIAADTARKAFQPKIDAIFEG